MTRSDGFSMTARAVLIQLKSSLTNPRPMSGQYTARTNAPHAIVNPISRTLPAADMPATAIARDSVGATWGRDSRNAPHETLIDGACSRSGGFRMDIRLEDAYALGRTST